MRNRLLLGLLVFFLGCTEAIEFDTDGVGRQIFIYGSINNSNLPQNVEIRSTTGIVNRSNPIDGARVTLKNSIGGNGTYRQIAPGLYRLNASTINVFPGLDYWIEITLLNGTTYQSVPETMPLSVATDSLAFNFERETRLSEDGVEVEENFINVSTATQIVSTDDPVYLRWNVTETYVLFPTNFPDPFNNVPLPFYFTVEPDPQRINVFNGEGFVGDVLSRRVIATREIDYTFLAKHFFTVTVASTSREAYDFWNQIDIVSNNAGSIFDIPPAKVRGNIFNVEDPQEEVLGYFEANTVSVKRFKLFVDDIPFTVPESGCLYDPSRPFPAEYPSYCTQCEIENCSTVRPPFFDD